MKIFKNYLSTLAVFALLFTSCSKEESSALDDADANFVELTFGATLNDLANRSQHLGDIPECGDTAPDYARISFSYGGNNYTVDVDILQDANGYYTDYSEQLKIPVSNGNTTVTLTGFLVFDSSHTRIWAAPVGGDFAAYVDQALPMNFDVAAGTKPYIDVNVLCFDERFVNEYGYVFFDIVPETIYPLCTFINYCNEAGRHWVANYSVDLYFGTNDEGIQLYDNNDDDAQVTVGTRDGQYYADPLCLVVPGPPANLPDDEPYLYMVIYPQDWTGNYGDIDNTPVPVQLSWNDVESLLNADGTTSEYLHLWVGECEGALDGDGSNGGGNPGGGDCDLTVGSEDCDDDGILNRCDPDNPYWNTFDCDQDGFNNLQDDCPYVAGVADGEDGVGCPEGSAVVLCLEDPETGCDTLEQEVTLTSTLRIYELTQGDLTVRITDEGLFVGLTPVVPYEIWDLEVVYDGTAVCTTSEDPDEGASLTIAGVTATDLPLTLSVRANYCEQTGE